MVCTKCNETGVLNTVLGQDFYYCRFCKEEIQLEEPKSKDEFAEWQASTSQFAKYFNIKFYSGGKPSDG